jgi:ribosomal-protein-alanine N-acetyltransferase
LATIRTDLSVRISARHDRPGLRELVKASPWKHQHLDWIEPSALIEQGPIVMAAEGGRPAACLACPDDPPGVAWIRLLAIDGGVDPEAAWRALWPEAESVARASSSVAAALPQEPWFRSLLEPSGFRATTEVLFLEIQIQPRAGGGLPGIAVRDMRPTDLPDVARVDRGAFAPLWRHSQETLAVARARSPVCRVAVTGGAIVGYALSTLSPYGGHLARLAVDPECQSRGIGSLLTQDTLAELARRDVDRVTVNTQADNIRSQELYRRLGFRETGPRYPVYTKDLQANIVRRG